MAQEWLSRSTHTRKRSQGLHSCSNACEGRSLEQRQGEHTAAATLLHCFFFENFFQNNLQEARIHFCFQAYFQAYFCFYFQAHSQAKEDLEAKHYFIQQDAS